ncbi:Spy/CpxP family protein refolding chaperone [Saccharicrinis aurantiacus]|uniref:Spy/CpxP family protein refolding chaperone n=1 Tax=Saccharicrinis aurantiacus TaxID=1849719 RepID=UPI0009503281|nr:Spy/CpxP family protein refolding chaperone [Saccharicrinis aurantiacus]
MKSLKVLALVAIVSVFGINNILAQKGSCNKGERQGQMKGKFFAELTDTQKEEIKALHVKFTKENMPIKDEITVLEAQLNKASKGDEVNTKEVNKLIDQISELKAGMMKKRFANKQEVRNLLTDEQKVMFDAHSGKMQGGKKGKGKPGQGQRGPRADRGGEHPGKLS